MRRRLLRGDEPCAHIDTVSTESKRGDKAPPIRHATRRHKWDLQLLGNPGQQDHIGDVVLARMAAALEPVDADRIAADPLGSQRMTHRGAFVDDLDSMRLQGGDVLRGIAAGGFDDPYAAFDDRVDIFRVGRRHERRQKGQIDAKVLVGHVAAAIDLARQILGCRLRQTGDDAEPAGIRHCGGHLGIADAMHTALDDRVFYSEEFGYARSHRSQSLCVKPFKRPADTDRGDGQGCRTAR